MWKFEQLRKLHIINEQNIEHIFFLLARGPEIISHGIAPSSEMGKLMTVLRFLLKLLGANSNGLFGHGKMEGELEGDGGRLQQC